MSTIYRLFDRLFGSHEDISGDGLCPYLNRWTLARIGTWKLYLHHFIGDDWSLDYHDHPKRFISIGLWGWYVEQRPGHENRTYKAPWIRSFPANHAHRLIVPDKNCWTLVLVLSWERQWGFISPAGKWTAWDEYMRGAEPGKRKSC